MFHLVSGDTIEGIGTSGNVSATTSNLWFVCIPQEMNKSMNCRLWLSGSEWSFCWQYFSSTVSSVASDGKIKNNHATDHSWRRLIRKWKSCVEGRLCNGRRNIPCTVFHIRHSSYKELDTAATLQGFGIFNEPLSRFFQFDDDIILFTISLRRELFDCLGFLQCDVSLMNRWWTAWPYLSNKVTCLLMHWSGRNQNDSEWTSMFISK